MRKGGRVYGGFVGICLWVGLVFPALATWYLLLGAFQLLKAITLTICVVVEHVREQRASTPAPQARYSNRR